MAERGCRDQRGDDVRGMSGEETACLGPGLTPEPPRRLTMLGIPVNWDSTV
jgi:hypothetical protein